MKKDLKLCYVKDNFAYFTTQKLSDQTGDDWNDAPYEYNAGIPYSPCWHNEPESIMNPKASRGYKVGTTIPLAVGELCRNTCCIDDWDDEGNPKWQIQKVAFDGGFNQPSYGTLNSPYSVDMINAGAVAWLIGWDKDDKTIAINPGCSIEDFIAKVELAGGEVFLPKDLIKGGK